MTTSLLEAPTHEPVTLAQIKQHLRISHDDEDDLLLDIARAARELVEHKINEKLIAQVWRQYEDGSERPHLIDIKLSPIRAINQITVFGKTGTPVVLSTDHYKFLPLQKQIEILAPALLMDCSNGIEIDVSVGMAETGNEIPDALKRAILLLIAHWYEFRGAVAVSEHPVSIPQGFEILIAPFKRVRI